MEALLEIFRSLIALLASAAFAQFGVTLEPKDERERPEVRRTQAEPGKSAPLVQNTSPLAVRRPAPQRGGA